MINHHILEWRVISLKLSSPACDLCAAPDDVKKMSSMPFSTAHIFMRSLSTGDTPFPFQDILWCVSPKPEGGQPACLKAASSVFT